MSRRIERGGRRKTGERRSRSRAASPLRQGVRFECQGSGRCCTARGLYGYVYLGLEDRRRLAAHLGLRTSSFTRRYCQLDDGVVHLKHPDRDCCFLRGHRCGVYAARPAQCRTWPFWPENMPAAAWREVSATCAGVGRGRRYSPEEIRGILAGQEGDDC
jgi:uncharacterized protein